MNRRSAFTLIELLAVITAIAFLAALLLPALSRAKASAKSTACKNNLRQLGVGLRLYVDDFDEYPLEYVWDEVTPWPPLAIWVDTLRPYCGESSPHRGFADQKGLFFCRPFDGKRQLPFTYNAYGSARGGPSTLGLGIFGKLNVPVAESRVQCPDDMIAISDGLGFGWPGGWLRPEFRPHGRDGNSVFCDGHVESSNPDILAHREFPAFSGIVEFQPNGAQAKRWNNDNQPHPETRRGYE